MMWSLVKPTMPLLVPVKKMSWKPFGDDVEFGEAHDALACAHEEDTLACEAL